MLTLKVATVATLVVLVFGVGWAYLFGRFRFRGSQILDAVLTLPMVMPPTVLGYYLLVVIGRRGWIGEWLEKTFGIRLIFTWKGAVIASALVAFPLVSRLRGRLWKASIITWRVPRACWVPMRRRCFSG